MPHPVVCVDNLCFSYESESVLENINFDLFEGEFLSIIGPNGGGKSTLLKILLGQMRPRSGSATILGLDPEKARPSIGYVPQHNQLDARFPITVLEVALMGRLSRGFFQRYKSEDRHLARESLEKVGMADKADASFFTLSGGQRQRVMIARALCTNAPILFLDEPTNNVDQASQDSLFQLLQNLSKNHTILLVSHDMDVVSSLTRRVLCLNRTADLHDTETLSTEALTRLYSPRLSLVRHDHKLSGAHSHD